jgi:hypothetical protein
MNKDRVLKVAAGEQPAEFQRTRPIDSERCQLCWSDSPLHGFVILETYRRGSTAADALVLEHALGDACFAEFTDLRVDADPVGLEEYTFESVTDAIWAEHDCGLCGTELAIERGLLVLHTFGHGADDADAIGSEMVSILCPDCNGIVETFVEGIADFEDND